MIDHSLSLKPDAVSLVARPRSRQCPRSAAQVVSHVRHQKVFVASARCCTLGQIVNRRALIGIADWGDRLSLSGGENQ
jgi:hypothetical protein